MVSELLSVPNLPDLYHQGSKALLLRGQPVPPSAGGRELSSSHALIHTSRASSTVLPSQGVGITLSRAAAYEGLGQLSHSHTPELAHRCHQGQVYYVVQVRCRVLLSQSVTVSKGEGPDYSLS